MKNAGELRSHGQPRRLSLRSQFLKGLDVLIFIAAQFLLSRSIAGHRDLKTEPWSEPRPARASTQSVAICLDLLEGCIFWGKGMYRSHSLDDPNRDLAGLLNMCR